MATSKDHQKNFERSEFCSVRAGKEGCKPCGDNHRTNAKVTRFEKGFPESPPWSFFRRQSWMSWRRPEIFFEAHHLLCVASVNQGVSSSAEVIEIVRGTKWRINAETNMLALPLWGHTLKYYCNPLTGTPTDPPNFADLPQHNYNHNKTGGYPDEVNKIIDAIAKEIQELKDEGHDMPAEELAYRLDSRSEEYLTLLKASRGTRCGGTHAAWEEGARAARENRKSDWYLPFSMASTKVTDARAFPTSGGNDNLSEKLDKLIDKLGFS